MTVKDVQKWVRDIASMAKDPECAHAGEDGLHYDVLCAIAHGAENAQALAKEAIKTSEIHFPRWCA
jgi:hypothetical protein